MSEGLLLENQPPALSEEADLPTRLLAAKERLADRVNQTLWEDPFWQARYGDAGHSRGRQDGVHHIQYLVEALRANDAAVFTNYARWLRVILCSRGMCSRHLVENLRFLSEAIAAERWSDDQDAHRMLRAGIDALAYLDGDAGAIDSMAAQLPRGKDQLGRQLSFFASYLADAVNFGEPSRFVAYVSLAADLFGVDLARSVMQRLRDGLSTAIATLSTTLSTCLAEADSLLSGRIQPADFGVLAGESREFAMACDRSGRVVYADSRTIRLLDLDLGDSLLDAAVVGVEDKLRALLQKAESEHVSGWELAFNVRSKPTSVTVAAAPGRHGILITGLVIEGFVEAIQQVSRIVVETVDQNRTLLEEKRRELLDVVEVLPDGIIIQDRAGAVIAFNAAAERLLGKTARELSGAHSPIPAWPAYGDDDAPFSFELHPAEVARRTEQPVRDVVMRLEKPDGVTEWLSVSAFPRRAPNGSMSQIITMLNDVTELRRANERAAHSERLVVAGTLAAGIGHEINNPLTYVLGNLEQTEAVLKTIDAPSLSSVTKDLLELNTEARDGAERIRKIVRALRAVSRVNADLGSVSVASTVEHALNLSAHECKRKAHVDVGSFTIPPVFAEEAGLTQVLVNLIVNAAKSFPRADPANNRISITAATRDDGTIALWVEDNGPGVPDKIRARIFDPFFTTRPVGQGTGLGLFISRNIITSFGGTLSLESRGQGARFCVVLRAAAPGTAPPPSPQGA